MKKRLLSMLLVICMVCSLLPAIALTAGAAEGDLPTILSVEPSETNNIPSRIDLWKASSGGGQWGGGGGSTTYELYLPGNVDTANCFFSWADGLQATMDGKTYASGACPVPAAGETKTYTFTKGNSTATFTVKTWKGAEKVPAIFIDIDESQGTISAMDNDPDHEKSCTGIIYIDGEQFNLDKIKGRGNYTWSQSRDKKAYNLTLDKKCNILGIDSAKTKKWSILAEVADHSLLCNRTGLQMAHQLDIGNDTASADVWMNGEYQGCYTVTPKYDSFVTKDGFLIEDDNYKEDFSVEDGGDPQFSLDGLNGRGNDYNLITVKKMGDNLLLNEEGVVDESAPVMKAAAEKIRIWLQDAWDAIRSTDGYNSKGKYYTDYIDIESFAKMYLMHEYVKSYDICAGSILFHRDGQTDADKLFAGPLWDLDNGMGSTQTNGNLGSVGDRRSGSGAFISEVNEYKTSIYKTISRHADFMEEVMRQYNNNREVFENAPQMLAGMIEDIRDSAMMNHNKVESVSYNNHNYGSDTTLDRGTEYEQNMKRTGDNKTDWPNYASNLQEYVRTRSLWFKNTYEDDSYLDQGFKATFVAGTGASVTVFNTQDYTSGGTANAQYAFARDGETGEIIDDGNGQVNFRVEVAPPYHVSKVTAEPAENFKNVKGPADTGEENCYRVTKITGPITITIETSECEHEWGEDGKCAKCGLSAYRVDFSCDEHCTVTAFSTQDLTGDGQANAQFVYARSKAGDIDISGDGQVNFIVNVDEGYKVSSIKADPAGKYKNLKGPDETLVINGYRATKVTGSFTLNIKTKEIGQGMDDVDFTLKEDESKYEVMGKDTYELVPSTGVTLTSTADAFEPLQGGGGFPGGGGQTTESTPKDLIRVPVGDDWTATLKLDFNQNNVQWAMNEYFAFLAMAGEDYQNMAGIRGTNSMMQDFLRKDGTITTTITGGGGGGFPGGGQQTPQTGFTATGTYWLRLEKEETTYTAYRSTDGETFEELFKLEDTGIEAEYIVIDAYKTSTWSMGGNSSYEYTLKELTFENDGPGPVLDRTALQKAIEDAEAVDKAKYTDETVAVLEEALKAAKQANISVDSDQAAIDAAAAALNAAIEALVERPEPVVDKTALDKAISDAEAIDTAAYTDDSVATLEKAVTDAKKVQADDKATQQQVDDAEKAVKDAIAALETKPEEVDTRELDAAVEEAGKIDKTKYTEDSVKALEEAVAAAEALGADATQAQIDAAAKAVKDAIAALEAKPDEFLFEDVKDPAKFFFDPVYWAFKADPQITKGVDDTHFGPDNACTRGHVVTFLWRAAGCPEPKNAQTPFKDLKKGAFYEKAVAWAVENEITNGLSADKFGPDATCTRGQIVTFLWRYKGKPDPKSAETPFKDLKEGGFYLDAVAWAVENEVTNGLSADKFGPDATCTRGQVVTFLYRATAAKETAPVE